jgi:hypothetical protein
VHDARAQAPAQQQLELALALPHNDSISIARELAARIDHSHSRVSAHAKRKGSRRMR